MWNIIRHRISVLSMDIWTIEKAESVNEIYIKVRIILGTSRQFFVFLIVLLTLVHLWIYTIKR